MRPKISPSSLTSQIKKKKILLRPYPKDLYLINLLSCSLSSSLIHFATTWEPLTIALTLFRLRHFGDSHGWMEG